MDKRPQTGEPSPPPSSFRDRKLAAANTAITLAESTLAEVEQLLLRVTPQGRAPSVTGISSLVRELRKEADLLRRIVVEIRGYVEDDAGDDDGDDLRQASGGQINRDGKSTPFHINTKAHFNTMDPTSDLSPKTAWQGGTREPGMTRLGNKVDASCTLVNHACLQWAIIKRCKSLRSVNQTFQASTKETRRQAVSEAVSSRSKSGEAPLGNSHDINSGREKAHLHRVLKEKGRAEVHVVDDGYEWLEVRSVNLDRLARQMTDAGWGWGEHESGDTVDEDEWEGVLLARQLRRTVEAARRNRCEYRIPRVRVVLPKLRRGENADVDVFLEQLVRIDRFVEVIIEDARGDFLTREPPPLEEALENLVVDGLAGLTETINMDHTILIDLISDITHARLTSQPWQAKTTQQQIEEENSHEGGVMAKTLYPVLRGRRLVCTMEAAEHFHEVLSTVGTDTERQRGYLLVPVPSDSPFAASSPLVTTADGDEEDMHRQFSSLSIHPPPPDVQIPVTVLPTPTDFDAAVADGRLPRLALDVARCGGFKSAKLSIYMHGWMGDLVTLTSNKEIRGQIRTWVEANRRVGEEEDVRGPRIFRLDATRNLLAKSATPPEEYGGGEVGGCGS